MSKRQGRCFSRHVNGRLDAHFYGDGHTATVMRDNGALVCELCGEWLSLGPANDDSEAVQIEMRALDMFNTRHAPENLTDMNIDGYHGDDSAMTLFAVLGALTTEMIIDWDVGHLSALIEDGLIGHGKERPSTHDDAPGRGGKGGR